MIRRILFSALFALLCLTVTANAQGKHKLDTFLTDEQKQKIDLSKLTDEEKDIIVAVISLGVNVGYRKGFGDGVDAMLDAVRQELKKKEPPPLRASFWERLAVGLQGFGERTRSPTTTCTPFGGGVRCVTY